MSKNEYKIKYFIVDGKCEETTDPRYKDFPENLSTGDHITVDGNFSEVIAILWDCKQSQKEVYLKAAGHYADFQKKLFS